MKELTKQIRKEVKRVIEEVGGTKNLLNKHINEIREKFLNEDLENRNRWNYACEVSTTIINQIHYFQYAKGM